MKLGFVLLIAVTAFGQDRDRDFSGSWNLDRTASNIQTRFDVPVEKLSITQDAYSMTVSAGGVTIVYPIAATPKKSRAETLTFNVATKWEGSALLANVIVGGSADYTLSERWSKSRNGGTLTIERTIEGHGVSEAESTLVYRNSEVNDYPAPQPVIPASPSGVSAPRLRPRVETPQLQTADYVLAPGTRILLRLTNSVNTKHSKPGDQIYLQTAAPIFQKGKLVVPQGSYVTGTITESKESGRIKGKAALNFRFDTLTLPNGVTRDFRSRAGSVDARGNLNQNEGRITADGTKGRDAATVAKTTGAGAGIGTIAGAAAGHVGTGLGIGSAAGAVAGLAGILGSHGQEVVISPGTTMEMVLDREVRFTPDELNRIR